MAAPSFTRHAGNLLATLSRGLGALRWAFLPLGLAALIACGVHAAADTVDDRLLWAVDALDAALDSFFSRFTFTQPCVNWVGLEQRVFVARGLAFIWELLADIALVAPAFGYRESGNTGKLSTWKVMAQRSLQRPTVSRIVRPLATACIVLAGACTVARMVQASFFSAVHRVLPDGLSGSFAKLLAVLTLGAVLWSLGGRAVMRNLEHAHETAERLPARRLDLAFTRGLWGSVLVAPLALAALLFASPLLSFFR